MLLASQVMSLASQVTPLASQVMSLALQVMPLDSQVMPLASQVMPLVSQVMPLVSQLMPLASQGMTTIQPVMLGKCTLWREMTIAGSAIVMARLATDKSNPETNLLMHSAVLAMAAAMAAEHRRQTKKPQRYHISEACKYHSPISICRHLIADT